MKKKQKPSRASRSAAPRGAASLTIQHERWMADRWKVLLRVNGVAFAIGAECDSREGAERLRADFGTALAALGVKMLQWPNKVLSENDN